MRFNLRQQYLDKEQKSQLAESVNDTIRDTNSINLLQSDNTWPGVQVLVEMDGGAPYNCDGQDFAAGQQFSGSLQIFPAVSPGMKVSSVSFLAIISR